MDFYCRFCGAHVIWAPYDPGPQVCYHCWVKSLYSKEAEAIGLAAYDPQSHLLVDEP